MHFIVGRLSKDGSATDPNAYDRMELWLNPSSATLGSATATANGPANSSFTGGIANFGLTTLSSSAVLEWDNLRIGTTQLDVIPEPATAMLVGLAALSLVLRRRRRI